MGFDFKFAFGLTKAVSRVVNWLLPNATNTTAVIGFDSVVGRGDSTATVRAWDSTNGLELITTAANGLAVEGMRYNSAVWYNDDGSGNKLHPTTTGVRGETIYKAYPDWAASTAVTSGDTVVARNRYYTCTSSGTTGSSFGGPTANTSANVRVVFEGDSITLGQGITPAGAVYPTQAGNLSVFNVSVSNLGVGAETIADMQADVSEVEALYSASNLDNIVVFFAGTNDIYFDILTDQQVYDAYVTYCNTVSSYGFKVIAVTALPRENVGTPAGFEARRQTFNTSLRANWESFADALVDVGNNSVIGQDGDPQNTTYYQSDKVHPTGYGANVIALEVSRKIDELVLQNTIDDGTAEWVYSGLYTGLPHVLFETAETNLALYSRDYTQSAWTKLDGLTVSAERLGIFGDKDKATSVIDASSDSLRGLLYLLDVPNDTLRRIVSFHVKKNGNLTSLPGFGLIYYSGGTQVVSRHTFNPSTGEIVDRPNATIVTDYVTVEEYNSWWRVTVALSNNGTGNLIARAEIWPAAAANINADWAQSNTGVQVIDQIDFVTNSLKHSSPIVTTTSTVTRAASTATSTQILSARYIRFRVADLVAQTYLSDGTNVFAWDGTDLTFTDGTTTLTAASVALAIGSTVVLDQSDGKLYVDESLKDTDGALDPSWGTITQISNITDLWNTSTIDPTDSTWDE